MSGQNTPISTALNTPRVSVETRINSDRPGIKTLLVDFFTGAKLFAKIQRTANGITSVTIQGHPKQFPASLDHLKELLQIIYKAAIVWGETSAVSEENRYNSITIEETLPSLKREPSSGEFLEKELEEVSFGGSAATENVKKIVKEALASVSNAAAGFAVAKGWIPAVQKEHISIKYKEETYDLEVSSYKSMSEVISSVDLLFSQPVPFKMLYRRAEDGSVHQLKNVKDLREGFLYYAITVNEELPKNQTAKFSPEMNEFFDKLMTEQELDDDDIQTIKDCFGKQKIKLRQLLATGELAVTDAKLERIGITQLGLRRAILAVIKTTI